jgi:membrane protein YdbS with pleckstrin-like domain
VSPDAGAVAQAEAPLSTYDLLVTASDLPVSERAAEATPPLPDSIEESIADGVPRQLDPRWITVQRIQGAIFTAVLSLATFVGVIIIWVASRMLFLGLLLVPLWMAVMAALAWQIYRWPPIAYRFESYRLDDDGLEIMRGVYWRTITTIPRSRVQHTDVSQGPLERRYGLGTLVVYTAGTQHSQVSLSGLDFTVARRIRTHLLPGDHSDAV